MFICRNIKQQFNHSCFLTKQIFHTIIQQLNCNLFFHNFLRILYCFLNPNYRCLTIFGIVPKVTLSYSTFTFKRIAFAIIVACSREKNLRVYLAYFILFLFSTTKVNHCYRITLQECAVEESAQLAIVVKYYCFQITTSAESK